MTRDERRPPTPRVAQGIGSEVEAHQRYLRRKDFNLRTFERLLPEGDQVLLRKYGHWLQALEARKIAPTTPKQRHFLDVCQGRGKPRNDFERAWVKWKSLAGKKPNQALARAIAKDTRRIQAVQAKGSWLYVKERELLRSFMDRVASGRRLTEKQAAALEKLDLKADGRQLPRFVRG